MNEIGESCISTMTFDREKELSKLEQIEKESFVDVEIYFVNHVSPDQRGLNENSNGIIGKGPPKSTDLSVYSQEELNIIANNWNSMPIKSLKYRTLNEIIKGATGFDNLLPFA